LPNTQLLDHPTPCWLSMTACSIYLPLPSISWGHLLHLQPEDVLFCALNWRDYGYQYNNEDFILTIFVFTLLTDRTLMGSLQTESLNATPGSSRAQSMWAQRASVVRFKAPPLT
jgi:hypothetical protein